MKVRDGNDDVSYYDAHAQAHNMAGHARVFCEDALGSMGGIEEEDLSK